MTKLLTASAIALLMTAPAFAEKHTDVDPSDTATKSEENASRAYSDLTDMGEDGDFRVFQDGEGRFFRLPRGMFMPSNGMDTSDTAVESDANADRGQSSLTN